jgi:hypothetical protein
MGNGFVMITLGIFQANEEDATSESELHRLSQLP